MSGGEQGVETNHQLLVAARFPAANTCRVGESQALAELDDDTEPALDGTVLPSRVRLTARVLGLLVAGASAAPMLGRGWFDALIALVFASIMTVVGHALLSNSSTRSMQVLGWVAVGMAWVGGAVMALAVTDVRRLAGGLDDGRALLVALLILGALGGVLGGLGPGMQRARSWDNMDRNAVVVAPLGLTAMALVRRADVAIAGSAWLLLPLAVFLFLAMVVLVGDLRRVRWLRRLRAGKDPNWVVEADLREGMEHAPALLAGAPEPEQGLIYTEGRDEFYRRTRRVHPVATVPLDLARAQRLVTRRAGLCAVLCTLVVAEALSLLMLT